MRARAASKPSVARVLIAVVFTSLLGAVLAPNAAAEDTTSTTGMRIVHVPGGTGMTAVEMVEDTIALVGDSAVWPGSGPLLRIRDDLPQGATRISIEDMNDRFEVVGSYEIDGVQHAYKWSEADGHTPIPSPDDLVANSPTFEARGISDDGWIVGIYRAEAGACGSDEVGRCGFLGTTQDGSTYDVATLQHPPPLGYFDAQDIELVEVGGIEQHVAVGFYLVWSDADPSNPWTTLDLGGAPFADASDINRNGEIVGTISPSSPGEDIEAGYWASPVAPLTRLGFLDGDSRSQANAINDSGVIVGLSGSSPTEPSAVYWTGLAPGPVDLGHISTETTSSTAWGLNEGGIVVGVSDGNAVLWDVEGGYEVGDVIAIEPIPDQTLDAAAGEFADFTVVSSGAASPVFELFSDEPPDGQLFLDEGTGDPDTARFFFFPQPSDVGLNTFTIEVSDSSDPSIPAATEMFTIDVVEGTTGPVTILVDESIVVIDDPRVLPPTIIEIVESIAVSDDVAVRPPVSITILEDVVVTDDPEVRPPATIEITEEIVVEDQPSIDPGVFIELTEQITVDDAVVVSPEALGTIGGTKWEDIDGDAVRDPGEAGIEGVTIYLDLDDDATLDGNEPSTTTDSDGAFAFPDLVPGEWVVREIVPAGFAQTFPGTANEGEHRVILAPGDTVTNATFGNQPVNLPPVIEPIDDYVVDVGQSIEIPVNVTDPEGDPFTKSVEGLPRGLVNGIIPFTPLPEESGQTFLVTVTAVQNDNPDNFDTETFTVTVTNRPPEIEPIDDVVGLVGSEIVVEPVITDPEGDDVTITWEGSPPNGLLNGIFILTPTEEQTDSVFEITVTATETGTPSNSASETFNVFVAGVPDGPTDPLDVDPVGVPGGDIEIEGGGFLPGSDVNVYFLSDPVLLGTTPVGPDGTFQTSFPLPEDASDGPHQIIVVGLDPSGEVRTLASDIEAIRDSDDDGLRDTEETLTGTNPENADTDGDGLIDGLDASWLVGYLNELPRDDFKRRWHRPVMKLTIGAAAFAVNLGEGETALDILDRLDRRADGCGTQPDRSDWIVDCDSQIEFRTLLGLYKRGIETLTLPDPIPWL